jgi:hypothetical protein
MRPARRTPPRGCFEFNGCRIKARKLHASEKQSGVDARTRGHLPKLQGDFAHEPVIAPIKTHLTPELTSNYVFHNARAEPAVLGRREEARLRSNRQEAAQLRQRGLDSARWCPERFCRRSEKSEALSRRPFAVSDAECFADAAASRADPSAPTVKSRVASAAELVRSVTPS